MVLTEAQQQAKAAVTIAQQELLKAQQKYAQADPERALADTLAKAKSDLDSSYIQPKRAEANAALADCYEAGKALAALQNVAGPSNRFRETLQEQANELTQEQSQLSQKIRTQRRSFLDSFPQAGTGGASGVAHTGDDFAMFILFIGALAAYIAIFVNVLPPFNYKWLAGAVGFLFAWVAINRLLLTMG